MNTIEAKNNIKMRENEKKIEEEDKYKRTK